MFLINLKKFVDIKQRRGGIEVFGTWSDWGDTFELHEAQKKLTGTLVMDDSNSEAKYNRVQNIHW